jgi:hypothetical protein
MQLTVDPDQSHQLGAPATLWLSARQVFFSRYSTGNPVSTLRHTSYDFLKGLLMMALVFAPIQGALSAPGHPCPADHHLAMMADNLDDSHHRTDTASEEHCCTQDCVSESCDIACGNVSVMPFLPIFTWIPLTNLYLVFQNYSLDAQTGRVTSPLLHPPQTSI